MQGGLGRFPFRASQKRGLQGPPGASRGPPGASKGSAGPQNVFGTAFGAGFGLQKLPELCRALGPGPPGAWACRGLQGLQAPGPPGASRGLQGPPDPADKASEDFGGFPAPGLQGPAGASGAGASRGLGLQGPPGASRFWAVTSPFGQILGGSQLAPLPQGPHPQICCS